MSWVWKKKVYGHGVWSLIQRVVRVKVQSKRTVFDSAKDSLLVENGIQKVWEITI